MVLKKIFQITLIIFVISILGLLLVLFTLPYSIKYFVKDIPQIDDSDLRLEEIGVIPEKDNAYFDLTKIKESIYFPYKKRGAIESMSNYKQWNQSMTEELINKNESAFNYFDNATHKLYYQSPDLDIRSVTMIAGIDTNVYLNEIALLSSIRARNFANQGKDM